MSEEELRRLDRMQIVVPISRDDFEAFRDWAEKVGMEPWEYLYFLATGKNLAEAGEEPKDRGKRIERCGENIRRLVEDATRRWGKPPEDAKRYESPPEVYPCEHRWRFLRTQDRLIHKEGHSAADSERDFPYPIRWTVRSDVFFCERCLEYKEK